MTQGVIQRACTDCGKLYDAEQDTSRCPDCRNTRESERTVQRASSEPWRVLYRMGVWLKARTKRKEIDRHQCVDCKTTRSLSVDHEIPIRKLWIQHRAWISDVHFKAFVAAACDVTRLRTRCPGCHRRAELKRMTSSVGGS